MATVFGYDAGVRAAYNATDNGKLIKAAGVALGIMSPAPAERVLEPMTLTDASRSAALADQMVAQEQQRVASRHRRVVTPVREAIYRRR